MFNGILYVLTTRFPSPTPGGNRSTPSWRRGLSRPPHTSRCSNVVSSYLRCSRSLRSFLEDLRSSRTPVPQLAPSVLELLPRKRFAFSHAPGRSLTASQAPDIVRRTVPAVAPYGSRSSKTFGLLELLPLRGSRSSHLAPAVLELRSIGTSFLAALELLPRRPKVFSNSCPSASRSQNEYPYPPPPTTYSPGGYPPEDRLRLRRRLPLGEGRGREAHPRGLGPAR